MKKILVMMLCVAPFFAAEPPVPEGEIRPPEGGIRPPIMGGPGSPGDMMLIWPELKQAAPPGAVPVPPPGAPPAPPGTRKINKALNSQKLLDKIQSLKKMSGSGRASGHMFKSYAFQEEPLKFILVRLSERHVLPPVVLRDGEEEFWFSPRSMVLGGGYEPHHLLQMLSEEFGFAVDEKEGIFFLTPGKVQDQGRLDMKLLDVPVSKALQSVFSTGKLNGILAHDIPDMKISLQVKNAPVRDMVYAICEAAGLQVDMVGSIFVVRKARFEKELEIEDLEELERLER